MHSALTRDPRPSRAPSIRQAAGAAEGHPPARTDQERPTATIRHNADRPHGARGSASPALSSTGASNCYSCSDRGTALTTHRQRHSHPSISRDSPIPSPGRRLKSRRRPAETGRDRKTHRLTPADGGHFRPEQLPALSASCASRFIPEPGPPRSGHARTPHPASPPIGYRGPTDRKFGGRL